MSKKYYAGYNGYGVRFDYDSLGWRVYQFNSTSERDAWVDEHYWDCDTNNIVSKPITRKDAEKILGHHIDYERVKGKINRYGSFAYNPDIDLSKEPVKLYVD